MEQTHLREITNKLWPGAVGPAPQRGGYVVMCMKQPLSTLVGPFADLDAAAAWITSNGDFYDSVIPHRLWAPEDIDVTAVHS